MASTYEMLDALSILVVLVSILFLFVSFDVLVDIFHPGKSFLLWLRRS
jgi:E3 ubiquitin-protein ligase DOA10